METIRIIFLEINNREKAIIFWSALFFMWALSKKEVRKSLFHLLKTFFAPKLFIIFLLFTSYVLILLQLFNKIGFWEAFLIKDTIVWFFGVGLVLFANIPEAKKDENFFKNLLINNFKVFVIIQFVINTYVFNLPIELIAVPIIALLGAMGVLAENKNEHKIIQKPITFVLSTIGFTYILFSFSVAFSDSSNFLTSTTLKKFTLPLGLTVLLIPLIYFLALTILYENVFLRLSFKKYYKPNMKNIKFAVIKTCTLNLARLRRFEKIIWDYDLSKNEELTKAMKQVKIDNKA
jgi:hypothetical protein